MLSSISEQFSQKIKNDTAMKPIKNFFSSFFGKIFSKKSKKDDDGPTYYHYGC